MKKYGKLSFTLILLALLLLLTIFSDLAGVGVRKGMSLSFRTLLPALFPSMVLCSMIGSLAEYIPLPPPITIWITSHLCGFPLGIRTLTQSYQRGLLTKDQALRLSACCSNASPAFLITYIGKGILGSTQAGFILFLGQLTISFLLGLLLKVFHSPPPPEPQDRPLLAIITESISSASIGGLQLTGYITLFAVAAQLMKNVPFFCYLYPFLELCGGLGSLPPFGRLYWVAAAAGFSGLSVLLQNAFFLAEEELPTLPLFFAKIIYCGLLPLFPLFFSSPEKAALPLILSILFVILRKALTNSKKRGIILKNQRKGKSEWFFQKKLKRFAPTASTAGRSWGQTMSSAPKKG